MLTALAMQSSLRESRGSGVGVRRGRRLAAPTAWVTLASFTLCGWWSSDARACPGAVCDPGEVFPTAGTVPVNHFQLAWQRLEGSVLEQDRLRVFRVSAEQSDAAATSSNDAGSDAGLAPGQLQLEVSDDTTALVTSPETLVEGDVLRVEYAGGVCDDLENERIVNRKGLITLGPAAELPTDLGTLDVETGEGYVDIRMGLCDDGTWLAYAILDVQLSESATPFADLLMYDVEVDGTLMPRQFSDQALLSNGDAWPSLLSGRNAYGDKVLLTADCTGNENEEDGTEVTPLTQGTHSVSIVASLPNGTRIASDTVSVTLACSTPVCQQSEYPWLDYPCPEADDDGVTRDGGAASDAGPSITSGVDAGTTRDSTAPRETTEEPTSATARDAAVVVEPDAGNGAESAQAAADDSSGCSCTLGAATSERQPLGWAGLLLGLSLWTRRRIAVLRAVARS